MWLSHLSHVTGHIISHLMGNMISNLMGHTMSHVMVTWWVTWQSHYDSLWLYVWICKWMTSLQVTDDISGRMLKLVWKVFDRKRREKKRKENVQLKRSHAPKGARLLNMETWYWKLIKSIYKNPTLQTYKCIWLAKPHKHWATSLSVCWISM